MGHNTKLSDPVPPSSTLYTKDSPYYGYWQSSKSKPAACWPKVVQYDGVAALHVLSEDSVMLPPAEDETADVAFDDSAGGTLQRWVAGLPPDSQRAVVRAWRDAQWTSCAAEVSTTPASAYMCPSLTTLVPPGNPAAAVTHQLQLQSLHRMAQLNQEQLRPLDQQQCSPHSVIPGSQLLSEGVTPAMLWQRRQALLHEHADGPVPASAPSSPTAHRQQQEYGQQQQAMYLHRQHQRPRSADSAPESSHNAWIAPESVPYPLELSNFIANPPAAHYGNLLTAPLSVSAAAAAAGVGVGGTDSYSHLTLSFADMASSLPPARPVSALYYGAVAAGFQHSLQQQQLLQQRQQQRQQAAQRQQALRAEAWLDPAQTRVLSHSLLAPTIHYAQPWHLQATVRSSSATTYPDSAGYLGMDSMYYNESGMQPVSPTDTFGVPRGLADAQLTLAQSLAPGARNPMYSMTMNSSNRVSLLDSAFIPAATHAQLQNQQANAAAYQLWQQQQLLDLIQQQQAAQFEHAQLALAQQAAWQEAQESMRKPFTHPALTLAGTFATRLNIDNLRDSLRSTQHPYDPNRTRRRLLPTGRDDLPAGPHLPQPQGHLHNLPAANGAAADSWDSVVPGDAGVQVPEPTGLPLTDGLQAAPQLAVPLPASNQRHLDSSMEPPPASRHTEHRRHYRRSPSRRRRYHRRRGSSSGSSSGSTADSEPSDAHDIYRSYDGHTASGSNSDAVDGGRISSSMAQQRRSWFENLWQLMTLRGSGGRMGKGSDRHRSSSRRHRNSRRRRMSKARSRRDREKRRRRSRHSASSDVSTDASAERHDRERRRRRREQRKRRKAKKDAVAVSVSDSSGGTSSNGSRSSSPAGHIASDSQLDSSTAKLRHKQRKKRGEAAAPVHDSGDPVNDSGQSTGKTASEARQRGLWSRWSATFGRSKNDDSDAGEGALSGASSSPVKPKGKSKSRLGLWRSKAASKHAGSDDESASGECDTEEESSKAGSKSSLEQRAGATATLKGKGKAKLDEPTRKWPAWRMRLGGTGGTAGTSRGTVASIDADRSETDGPNRAPALAGGGDSPTVRGRRKRNSINKSKVTTGGGSLWSRMTSSLQRTGSGKSVVKARAKTKAKSKAKNEFAQDGSSALDDVDETGREEPAGEGGSSSSSGRRGKKAMSSKHRGSITKRRSSLPRGAGVTSSLSASASASPSLWRRIVQRKADTLKSTEVETAEADSSGAEPSSPLCATTSAAGEPMLSRLFDSLRRRGSQADVTKQASDSKVSSKQGKKAKRSSASDNAGGDGESKALAKAERRLRKMEQKAAAAAAKAAEAEAAAADAAAAEHATAASSPSAVPPPHVAAAGDKVRAALAAKQAAAATAAHSQQLREDMQAASAAAQPRSLNTSLAKPRIGAAAAAAEAAVAAKLPKASRSSREQLGEPNATKIAPRTSQSTAITSPASAAAHAAAATRQDDGDDDDDDDDDGSDSSDAQGQARSGVVNKPTAIQRQASANASGSQPAASLLNRLGLSFGRKQGAAMSDSLRSTASAADAASADEGDGRSGGFGAMAGSAVAASHHAQAHNGIKASAKSRDKSSKGSGVAGQSGSDSDGVDVTGREGSATAMQRLRASLATTFSRKPKAEATAAAASAAAETEQKTPPVTAVLVGSKAASRISPGTRTALGKEAGNPSASAAHGSVTPRNARATYMEDQLVDLSGGEEELNSDASGSDGIIEEASPRRVPRSPLTTSTALQATNSALSSAQHSPGPSAPPAGTQAPGPSRHSATQELETAAATTGMAGSDWKLKRRSTPRRIELPDLGMAETSGVEGKDPARSESKDKPKAKKKDKVQELASKESGGGLMGRMLSSLRGSIQRTNSGNNIAAAPDTNGGGSSKIRSGQSNVKGGSGSDEVEQDEDAGSDPHVTARTQSRLLDTNARPRPADVRNRVEGLPPGRSGWANNNVSVADSGDQLRPSPDHVASPTTELMGRSLRLQRVASIGRGDGSPGGPPAGYGGGGSGRVSPIGRTSPASGAVLGLDYISGGVAGENLSDSIRSLGKPPRPLPSAGLNDTGGLVPMRGGDKRRSPKALMADGMSDRMLEASIKSTKSVDLNEGLSRCVKGTAAAANNEGYSGSDGVLPFELPTSRWR